jgi:non-canonical poly(A) RNA polymerase PAPD5/7
MGNCVVNVDQYAELRPLAFVLKTFIYSSNLYDTYQGGLSSYGLILMIVAFLQREYMFKKPDEKLLVSELLIKFLRFFGYEFDYVKKYICVEGPSTTEGFIVP